MKTSTFPIEGLILVEPDVFGDHRGYFFESYSLKKYETAGIGCTFVQDNQSFSAKKGIIRGLHFQHPPYAQAKLVRCTRGRVMDVAVDLRKSSPTFLKWISVELSEENKRQLFIPRGFAHGFVTLTDNCELQYKADNYYAPEADGAIAYNDPQIGVEWEVENPVLSAKDAAARPYGEQDIDF